MDTSEPTKPQNAGSADVENPIMGKAIQAGHETTDVSVRGLIIFTVGFLVTIIAVLIGLVVVFKVYSYADTRLKERIERQEPGAASRVHLPLTYGGPLLQVKPEDDLLWMRDHNAESLNGYGWVDRPAGVVRLPIDRAMDLIAQRGLPPVAPNHTLEELQKLRAQPQAYGQNLRP